MNSVRGILFQKENVIIASLFLLFFPIKAFFYNSVYVIFDAVINSGFIYDNYTFNYRGEIVGCLKIKLIYDTLGNQADIYFNTINIFLFVFSLIFGLVLSRKKKTQPFNVEHWVFLVMFSFYLYNALEILVFHTESLFKYVNKSNIHVFVMATITVLLAVFIFFKFSFSTKFKIIVVALPVSVIGMFVWYLYLGPYVLPLNI